MQAKIGLSFSNVDQMNELVDQLPQRSEWFCTRFTLDGYDGVKPHEVWHRSLKECIESIIASPHLAPHMIWVPEQHFSTADCQPGTRQYSEMNTGTWWWKVQVLSPDGSTIIPLIFSTDKTQLTNFSGDKAAYPVYVTIGNIPSWLRRREAQLTRLLVGYLPTDAIVNFNGTIDEKKAYGMALFHAAIKIALKDFEEAGNVGGWKLKCGDGHERHCILGLASYPSDYPEQCLVTCCNGCPKCDINTNRMGENEKGNPRTPEDTYNHIRIALSMNTTKSCNDYLAEHGLKPIRHPWWLGIKNCDVHEAMTPDMLHQVWQGVIKRLTEWLIAIIGAKEFDLRAKAIPRSYNARYFHKGVSSLSQLSGGEHRELAKILLCCVQGLPDTLTLTEQDRIDISASTRGLVDFAYISMYKQHDDTTLSYLQDSLDQFHRHKDVFVRLHVAEDLDLPKVHSLQHYIDSIKLIGVTGGVSTEEFEHAHISSAKIPWALSNHRDPIEQMVLVTEREEKIKTHSTFVQYTVWKKTCKRLKSEYADGVKNGTIDPKKQLLTLPSNPFNNPIKQKRKRTTERLKLAKRPTRKKLSISIIASKNTYQCTHFTAAMKDFIYRRTHPQQANTYSISRANKSISLDFDSVDCWDRLCFNNPSISGIDRHDGLEYDVIHAKPWQLYLDRHRGTRMLVSGRQDTCLIQDLDPDEYPGLSSTFNHLPCHGT